MNSALGARLQLDRSLAPIELQSSIPIVERWGFAHQDYQDEYLEMMTAFPAEVASFQLSIDRIKTSVIEWGKSLTRLNSKISNMTAEDWNHPYWAFLRAMKMRELTGYPADLVVRQHISETARKIRYQYLLEESQRLFAEKNFSAYVQLVSDYESMMTESQRAKLRFAKVKAGMG